MPFLCGCGLNIDSDHWCYFYSPTSKEMGVPILRELYYLRKKLNLPIIAKCRILIVRFIFIFIR